FAAGSRVVNLADNDLPEMPSIPTGPIACEAGEDDLLAGSPTLDHVGTSSDVMGGEGYPVVRVGIGLGGVRLDRFGVENKGVVILGHGRNEGWLRDAKIELHSRGVDDLDLLKGVSRVEKTAEHVRTAQLRGNTPPQGILHVGRCHAAPAIVEREPVAEVK